MEKPNKKKHRHREQSSGYQRRSGSWEKWVKGVNSMMMNRNLTFGACTL